MGDKVTCTTCHPYPPFLPLPCTSPQVTPLLFLYWHHGVLFVLGRDGKVVRPVGGHAKEENQFFCIQEWKHKKKEGIRASNKDVHRTALHFFLAVFPKRKLDWPFQWTRIIGVGALFVCFFDFHQQSCPHLSTFFSGLSIVRLKCWPN